MLAFHSLAHGGEMTEHNAGYKLLFSDPNITRSLLADFLPPEWLSQLDVSQLVGGEPGYLFRVSH